MVNNNQQNGTQNPFFKQGEQDNQFSLTELISKSLNYIPLFIIFVVAALTITFIYIRYQNPVYSTSIKLLIKDVNKRNTVSGSDQLMSDFMFNSRSNLANELEIIKSESIMDKVVRTLQLNTVYYSHGKVRTIELYDTIPSSRFIIFSDIKDSTKSYNITVGSTGSSIFYLKGEEQVPVMQNVPVNLGSFTFTVRRSAQNLREDYQYSAYWYPPSQMAESLAGQLQVAPLNKDASILTISLNSPVPMKSRVILNSLAYHYNQFNIDENNKIAENTINFIDERLLLISGELGTVESSLKNFRETNNIIDIPAQQSIQLNDVSTLKDKLSEQEMRLNIAKMVSDYVSNPGRKFNLVPSTLGIEDATLLGLVSTYNAGVLKREELLKTLGENNVAITTLEDQLEQMRQKIIENVNNVKAAYTSAYNQANSQYRRIMGGISTIPEKQKQLLEIQRQQGIKEKLYLFLLEKREESAISRAAVISKSSAIDRAKSSGPVSPQTSNLYLMALAAGLGIPLLDRISARPVE